MNNWNDLINANKSRLIFLSKQMKLKNTGIMNEGELILGLAKAYKLEGSEYIDDILSIYPMFNIVRALKRHQYLLNILDKSKSVVGDILYKVFGKYIDILPSEEDYVPEPFIARINTNAIDEIKEAISNNGDNYVVVEADKGVILIAPTDPENEETMLNINTYLVLRHILEHKECKKEMGLFITPSSTYKGISSLSFNVSQYLSDYLNLLRKGYIPLELPGLTNIRFADYENEVVGQNISDEITSAGIKHEVIDKTSQSEIVDIEDKCKFLISYLLL